MMNAYTTDSSFIGSDVVLLFGKPANEETADPGRDQHRQLIQLPGTLAVKRRFMVEIELDIKARRLAAAKPFANIGQIIPTSSEANADRHATRSGSHQEMPGTIVRLAAFHNSADISELFGVRSSWAV